MWSVFICSAAWCEIPGLGHLRQLGLAGGSWRVAVAYGKTAPGDSHSLTDDGNPYESCPCLCHHDHAPALFCVSSCVSVAAP